MQDVAQEIIDGTLRPDRPLRPPGAGTAGTSDPPPVASTKPTSGDLYLLDGNSLVFRAFFALPIDLATKRGPGHQRRATASRRCWSICCGTTTPSGIGVAFDRPEPTFRDDIVEEYKGNRPETPDLLVPQFALVRDVLRALGIVTVLRRPGTRPTTSWPPWPPRPAMPGRDVVVVTGDRDTFQLVEDPHIKVMYTRRGISDTVVYDEAGIEERYGRAPGLYAVLASLRGDPRTTWPASPAWGRRRRPSWSATYGDLDNIFAHLAEQTPKLRQNSNTYS